MTIKNKRICILLAGAHRSGSSAFSGMLSMLGCSLPKTLIKEYFNNQTEHFESETLLKLNSDILESAGSRWDDWTPCIPEWLQSPRAAEYKERARNEFQKEFLSSSLMVFKDPRLCQLLPFWIEVLKEADIQPLIMLPFRNPVDVAASLAAHDESDEQYNLLLWLRLVLDAEYASRGLPRFFSNYDQLLNNWNAVATDAQKAFDIKWPRMSNRVREDISAYISQNRRHHHTLDDQVINTPSLSPWVRNTFEILLAWNESGENPIDFPALDRIRKEVDASVEAFGSLTYRGNILRAENLNLKRHLISEQDRSQRLEDEKASINNDKAELEYQFNKALSEKDQVVSALKTHIDDLETLLAKIHDEWEQKLNATQSALGQRSAEVEDLYNLISENTQQIAQMRAERDQAISDAQHQKHLRHLDNILFADSQKTVGRLIQLLRAYSSRKLPLLWRFTADRRAKNLKAANLIDETWYKEKYPDVSASGMSPAKHYSVYGIAEGRSPSPMVDKFR